MRVWWRRDWVSAARKVKYHISVIFPSIFVRYPGHICNITMYCLCRGGICPCRQYRRQCKIFASGVNFSIFTHFFVFFPTKTVEIRWNWRCKILSLKIRRCKFLNKFRVCCYVPSTGAPSNEIPFAPEKLSIVFCCWSEICKKGFLFFMRKLNLVRISHNWYDLACL